MEVELDIAMVIDMLYSYGKLQVIQCNPVLSRNTTKTVIIVNSKFMYPSIDLRILATEKLLRGSPPEVIAATAMAKYKG